MHAANGWSDYGAFGLVGFRMLAFLVHRLLATVVVMAIVAVFIFLLLHLSPGDPAAIVADSGRIRALLGWAPRFDDLETIVGHALKWEHCRAGVKAAALPTGR